MSGLPLCLRNSLPACGPDLITRFHPAIACKGSSTQQVPRQMSRISVVTQLTGPYWTVVHHPRAALLSLPQASQVELVLRVPNWPQFPSQG